MQKYSVYYWPLISKGILSGFYRLLDTVKKSNKNGKEGGAEHYKYIYGIKLLSIYVSYLTFKSYAFNVVKTECAQK